MSERWDHVDISRLRQMLGVGKTATEIAKELKVSPSRVKTRIIYEGMSAEKKQLKYEAVKAHRSRYQRAAIVPYNHVVALCARPSRELMDDAQKRADAPRSLTAAFFGDPPAGFSALEQRSGK